MNEIEKMYENAEVEPEIIFIEGDIDKKEIVFTAEKQLSLTKLIGLRYGLQFITNEGMDYILSTDLDKFDKQGYGYGYDEAIANLINNLWQDLTEEERTHIREILE